MSDRYLYLRALEEIGTNKEQLAAINEKGHCVLLAGPGSGKTRTLTTAIARALLEDVEEPRGIACITYNNECAIELETRLGRLGIESNNYIFIGTVHSFALTQVIIPYARCVFPDFPASIQVASRQQCDTAIKVAYERTINGQEKPKDKWFAAQDKRRKEVDRNHRDWMGKNPDLALFIEAYEKELRDQGLLDFDDMTIIAFRMIKDHKWIRESLKAKFPILFVDEYQDLGTALHELVLQLCFKSGIRLFAVGDPDQSIYKFIGADPELFKTLSRRKDVKKISLPFNYRCGTKIIDASNAALGEERSYRAPEGAEQGNIVFEPIDGEIGLQAEHIMKTIVPRLQAEGVPLEEIAILYRDADDGDLLASRAGIYSIPFVRADRNALAPRNNRLSRLIESAASWVTGGWREANPTFYRLSSQANSFVFSGRASSEEIYTLESELAAFLHETIDSKGSTHEWLLKFKDELITKWKQRSRTVGDDWDVIDRMLVMTNPGEGQDISLPYFSGRIEQSGRLNLSTLHSAKGREFDVVIMFGLNKDTFPNKRDQYNPEQLREVRRLFYVAVTRARRELYLVFKRKYYSPWVLELYKRLNKPSQ